jgi:formylmethanofuran dehydrogenase subunit E
MPDNYSVWERNEREQERRLALRPVCEDCGEPIQDEYYFEVEGEILCEECMHDRYRQEMDTYG